MTISKLNIDWLNKAIKTINEGDCRQIDKRKYYCVPSIIRIDY